MFEGETILSGAPDICPDCEVKPELSVQTSMSGYYLGTWCDCGPYSRESGYFRTRKEAEDALLLWEKGITTNARY